VLQALWAAGERDWLAPYVVKSIVEGEPLDALLRLPAAVSRWFVAIEGEQIVGFALLIRQRVVALWVRPAWRLCGIGRRLIDVARALAQQRGFPFMEIEYPAGNKTAVAFCRTLGFRPASRRTVAIDGQRVGSGVVFALLPRKFSHARWVRALPLVGVATFAYLTILSALDGEAWRAMWFFLAVTLAMAASMVMTEFVIWTDVDGLTAGYRNSRLRHMPWADLRAIRGDPLGQTFTLHGAHDKIRTSSTRADIAWLFETIRRARPDLWRKTGKKVFRIRPVVPLLLLALSVGWWAFLIVAAVFGPGGGWWEWLLLALIGVYPMVLLLRRPYRLQLEADALRVGYLGREELISATAIDHIWTERAGTVAISGLALELRLVDGRRLNLSGFEGNVGELANNLLAWRRQALPDEAPDEP
jgi:GNAT superfamily N-acetyltransferase